MEPDQADCEHCNMIGDAQFFTTVTTLDGKEHKICNDCCAKFISDRLFQGDERLLTSLTNWIETSA